MSVYESISRASLKSKRRLFDYNVSILGKKMKAIRISYREDMFQDVEIHDAISHESIDAIMRFPSEMPLDRYRLGATEDVGETRTYFYDILPIESYTKLGDHIEKNDFLFFFLEDERDNKIPYLLQVTDSFGKFEIGLVWKKQYLAPYHGKLTDEIIKYLEAYVISEEYDQYKEENEGYGYLANEDDMDGYISDAYENLYPYPLSPQTGIVNLAEGNYVVQCAFGSMNFLGTVVTPQTPAHLDVEGFTGVEIEVSEDCQYPSIYLSNFFHPFVYHKKKAFSVQGILQEKPYAFKMNFEFFQHNMDAPIVFTDLDNIILSDSVSIVGLYGDEFRPLFYIEDSQGNFISIRVKENFEIVVVSKTGGETLTHSFGGIVDFHETDLSLVVRENSIEVSAIETTITVENTGIFVGKKFSLGYEPERYLNDFLNQIYF